MKSIRELLDLTSQSAIVTGGAKGIGLGVATRFCQAGASVLIADVDIEAAEKSASGLVSAGYIAQAVQVDVSNEADVDNMIKQCVKSFGSIDVLVNNAGIFPPIPISEMSEQDFERVLKVNLLGTFITTKKAAEQMKEQGRGGKIINITSIDALHPSMIGLAHYDASKHGMWGFTKNAALEYAADKIWINAIAPGGVQTPGVEAMQGSPDATENRDVVNTADAFLSKIPMHRMGEPDDIGKVALFLASEMSSYMTGTQIVVDGGALLS